MLFLLLLLPLLFLLLFLMMILIIYWVYLSSEHLFQVYTKYDGLLLQNVTAFLLQSVVLLQSATISSESATGITKSDDYYNVRQNKQASFFQTQCSQCVIS